MNRKVPDHFNSKQFRVVLPNGSVIQKENQAVAGSTAVGPSKQQNNAARVTDQ